MEKKFEQRAENNRQAVQLAEKHISQVKGFINETSDLEARARARASGNFLTRGFTETGDLFGFAVKGVSISEAIGHQTKLEKLLINQGDERYALAKQGQGTVDFSSPVSSVLEHFIL